jgi:DNA repair exonuclease SbcCD ATPase subunit
MYVAEIEMNDAENILDGGCSKFVESINKVNELILALKEYRKRHDIYLDREKARLTTEKKLLNDQNIALRNANQELRSQLNDALEFDQLKGKKRSLSTSDISNEKKEVANKTCTKGLKKNKKELKKLKEKNKALTDQLHKNDWELTVRKQENTFLATNNFRLSAQISKLEKEKKVLAMENKALKEKNEQLASENKILTKKLDTTKKQLHKSHKHAGGSHPPSPGIFLFSHFSSPRTNENSHKSGIPTPQVKFV